jgi:hypothetical protein
MSAALSRNSSQSPACMRRSPASHCCQVRSDPCTRLADCVCVRPAASRPAMMSAGTGFAEGPFGPRFGWLLIVHFFNVVAFGGDGHLNRRTAGCIKATNLEATAVAVAEVVFCVGGPGVQHGRREVVATQFVVLAKGGSDLFQAVGVNTSNLHIYLQAPDLPRRAGQRCAVHAYKYTRNERMRQALKTHSSPDTPFYWLLAGFGNFAVDCR